MTLQQQIEDKAKEYEEYTPKACFEDGANYVASLYSCTPDEVKKMREALQTISERTVESHIAKLAKEALNPTDK